jgi:hypothetical protein
MRRHFSRVPLQALLFARSLRVTCPVAAPPHAKGNKKSAVTPHPPCLGQWPTAPSVDSVQVVNKYQRPSVIDILLRAKSDITAQALAYSLPVNIVKIFLCHLSNCCRNGISMR